MRVFWGLSVQDLGFGGGSEGFRGRGFFNARSVGSPGRISGFCSKPWRSSGWLLGL